MSSRPQSFSAMQMLAVALAAAAALSPHAAARSTRLPSLRGESAHPRQLLDVFLCGSERQRCCPGDVCSTPDLTCRIERCRPCGGVLEPVCTAPGTAPCEDGLVAISEACFTDPTPVPAPAEVPAEPIEEEEEDELVLVLAEVPTNFPPEPAAAPPPADPPVEPPAMPPMMPAPAPAPMPAGMAPTPAPDMPDMPSMGMDMDAVALLMEFDGECGDVGMPCCVLAMVAGGGSVGACITGACATTGEAICEDVDCEEAGGTESVGVCLSLVEGAMVMPEDGGTGPMPAAAAPMPAAAPPMPAVAAPMPAV